MPAGSRNTGTIDGTRSAEFEADTWVAHSNRKEGKMDHLNSTGLMLACLAIGSVGCNLSPEEKLGRYTLQRRQPVVEP
jgi:hypothetical protein